MRFGAAMELGRWNFRVVMRTRPPMRSTVMGLRRVLAPTFQAGEMPLFIPWRRRAPRRPSIARSAESDPLAPPGPVGRFLFSVIRFGAAMELGRWSYGVGPKPDRIRRTIMGLRRVLAPTFQAGGMPLFIPWRRRAPPRPASHGLQSNRSRRLAANVADFLA